MVYSKQWKEKKKNPVNQEYYTQPKFFQKEWEIKTLNKDKLRKFTTTRLDLGDLLKSILQAKKSCYLTL